MRRQNTAGQDTQDPETNSKHSGGWKPCALSCPLKGYNAIYWGHMVNMENKWDPGLVSCFFLSINNANIVFRLPQV